MGSYSKLKVAVKNKYIRGLLEHFTNAVGSLFPAEGANDYKQYSARNCPDRQIDGRIGQNTEERCYVFCRHIERMHGVPT